MENKEFYIDKDGFKLHAKLDFPAAQEEKMPMVILFHGLTGHMEERHIVAVSEAITESGYVSLRVELYGHGKSDGAFENHNVAEWINEIIYVIDYARALPFVSRVLISGHSQGGLSIIMAAALKADQLAGIMPLAPANVIVDACRTGLLFGEQWNVQDIPEELHLWEDKYVKGNYVRTARVLPYEEAMKAYKGPVLIVHGTADEAVPVSYGIQAGELYENAELVLIEGDDHCYDYHLDQVTEAVKNWLIKQK